MADKGNCFAGHCIMSHFTVFMILNALYCVQTCYFCVILLPKIMNTFIVSEIFKEWSWLRVGGVGELALVDVVRV